MVNENNYENFINQEKCEVLIAGEFERSSGLFDIKNIKEIEYDGLEYKWDRVQEHFHQHVQG